MNTFFLDQFLKTSALLLVAAALVPIVARRSAARARLIWASAFAALLVLPLTAFVSPRWEYGNQAPPPIRVGPPPEIEIIRVAQPEAVAPVTPAVEAAPPLVVRTAKHWTWPSAGTCMFWGWVVGAGLLLVRRIGAAIRLSFFQRRLERVASPRLLAMAREILGERSGILRMSDAVAVPLTWGVWNPVIVLPSEAEEWPESRLRAALLHEWAHVRGADCFLRLVATVVTAVHWPNPLVWLTSRSLRAAQEQACDDFALAAGVEPQDYATQLVAAARAIRRCPAGALAMAKPSTLGIRVRAVCDPHRDRSAAGWSARMIVVSAMVALVAASTLAAPGENKAALPPIEPSPGSQVTISSHFIEVSPEQMRGLFPNMKAPGLLGVVPDAEAAGLLERIKAFGDQTAVAKKAVKPEMWDLFDPKSGRADFLTSPRVTTNAGQQAIIEIIREVRYQIEDGTFEVMNKGVTLQVEPQGFTDFTMLDIGCSLVELKPEAEGKKITRDSFYRVGWKDPKLQLPRVQTLIVGGWDTIRKGRQLLVFVHASSQVSTLTDIAERTQIPALEFANTPISDVAKKLGSFALSTTPPNPSLAKVGSQMESAESQIGEQIAKVEQLKAQLRRIKLLKPEQLMEARRILNISDPTNEANLPELQAGVAANLKIEEDKLRTLREKAPGPEKAIAAFLELSSNIAKDEKSAQLLVKQTGEQTEKVQQLRTQIAQIEALKPEQLMEALRILNIDDPTITAKIPELLASGEEGAKILSDQLDGMRRALATNLEIQEDTLKAFVGKRTQARRERIVYQPEAGQPEPRVTLKLPAGSLADALRRVAQNADLSIFAGEPDGRFVFAAPPLSDISERAARIVLPGIRTKGRSLQTVVTEICDEGILQDLFRFRAPVWLGNLPPLVKAMPVVIDAKNITLRDALFLAAKAAGAELSVDKTTFHIHPRGKAPRGTTLVGGGPPAVAREATESEIASSSVSVRIHAAELTVEQIGTLPAFKKGYGERVLKSLAGDPAAAPFGAPPEHVFVAIDDPSEADLAAIKAAGIAISSPPAVKTPENKRTKIRVRKLVRADRVTEFADMLIEPAIGPHGTQIDLNICPSSGEEKDGQMIADSRRITTNITVQSGANIVVVHRPVPSSGKIIVFFITPTLP